MRLPNELLSRHEMRTTPPHLLLTNYAMLEYLLLRPQDMDLFDGEASRSWRFVVVDEAHVYDGAKGAELAMLLRRLRDRVAPEHDLQAIATSATVGADGNPTAVTDFAANLFGVPFEWVRGDPLRQDLVTLHACDESPTSRRGDRCPAAATASSPLGDDRAPPFAPPPRAHGWAGSGDGADALRTEARIAGVRARHRDHGHSTLAPSAVPRRASPEAATLTASSAGATVGPADRSSAMSSRFHLFVRATEGAFSCLGPRRATPVTRAAGSSARSASGSCSSWAAVAAAAPCICMARSTCRRPGWHTPVTVAGRTDKRHAWLLLDDATTGDHRP